MELIIEGEYLNGVKVIRPNIFEDERGFFMEVYREDQFAAHDLPTRFMQENQSGSVKGVIRGLHFQWEPPMGKLMRVIVGTAFLVAVDIRKGSPTLGEWIGLEASATNRKQVWAPAGFARGFCVLSEAAEIQYLCTGIYNNQGESGIMYSDPDIGIDWPVDDPILSEKDRHAQTLKEWLQRPESDHFSFQD